MFILLKIEKGIDHFQALALFHTSDKTRHSYCIAIIISRLRGFKHKQNGLPT
jgi:hypothetical protein